MSISKNLIFSLFLTTSIGCGSAKICEDGDCTQHCKKVCTKMRNAECYSDSILECPLFCEEIHKETEACQEAADNYFICAANKYNIVCDEEGYSYPTNEEACQKETEMIYEDCPI